MTTDQPLLREDLAFYGLPVSADGARAVLYRNYHLCGVEAPLSVAEAALLGRPTGAALPLPVADGTPGEGYPLPWTVYRWLPGENATVAPAADPLQLASDLCGFIAALQRIDTAGAPAPGGRGGRGGAGGGQRGAGAGPE